MVLGGEGAGSFYSDSSCSLGNEITSTDIGPNASSTTYYFKGTTAGPLTFNASASGLSSGTLGVTVDAGSPSSLGLSGPSSVLATATCTGHVLTSSDGFNNNASVTANLTVALSSTGAGNFYSNPGCTNSITSAVILAGTSSTTVYYKNSTAQTVALGGTSAGFTAASLNVTVNPGAPTKLILTGPVSTGAGTCSSAFTVTTRDAHNNVSGVSSSTTILLQGGGSGAFYSDSACSTGNVISSKVLTLGVSSATFYFKSSATANLVLNVDDGPAGLTDGSLSFNVIIGSPAKLAFQTSPPASAVADANFTSQPVVAVQDPSGNTVPSATNAVTLTAYTDSSCSTSGLGVLAATTNPVSASNGIATFAGVAYRKAGTVYLKAQAGGLTSACSSATAVAAGTFAKISVSIQPSASAVAGVALAQGPIFRMDDLYDNAVTFPNTSITFSASADANCLSIARGTFAMSNSNPITSSGGFATMTGVSYTMAGPLYIKASNAAGTITGCTNAITINPATATRLGFIMQPLKALTGVELTPQPKAAVLDQYKNVVPGTQDTITLTAHDSLNCTGTASGTFSVNNSSLQTTSGASIFTGVSYNRKGLFSLKATSSAGYTTACSLPIYVDSNPVMLGNNHTCQLLNSGSVQCWGSNAAGNLGNNTTNNSSVAVTVQGSLSNARTLTPGSNFNCVVTSDNDLRCWGQNNQNQVASGSTSNRSTAQSAVLGGVASAGSGLYYNCAVMLDGTAQCWGQNTNGMVGDGTTTNRASPTPINGLSGVIAIAGSNNVANTQGHSCALNFDGTIQCWGVGASGQLGIGNGLTKLVPVVVPGLSNVISVAVGNSHTCALLSDQTVKCWGRNVEGQVGTGAVASSYTVPQVVSGLTGVVALSAGTYGNCALISNGTVKCWGANTYGGLGDGGFTNRNAPVDVGLTGIVSVSTGNGHTCAQSSGGVLYCWGDDRSTQLGRGTNSTDFATAPKTVSGITTATRVSAGSDYNCAILSDKTVRCWGSNVFGQLGVAIPTTGPSFSSAPQSNPSGLANVTDVSSGTSTTCARMTGGAAMCWGLGTNGQRGSGTTTSSSTPEAVTGITTSSTLGLGATHSCTRLSNDHVSCWGLNTNAQVSGNASVTPANASTAAEIVSLVGIAQVAAGLQHSCALYNDGTVGCWGADTYGTVSGTGAAGGLTAYPTTVSGISGATALTLGNQHACTLLANQTVKCWGRNNSYQIGTTSGTIVASSTISGLTGITKVSAGPSTNTTCAIGGAGKVYCWGANSQGQFLNGSTAASATPVEITGITNAIDVTVGTGHMCAVISGGTVKCWGDNVSGQMGDNVPPYVVTPVVVTP